jgi:hypothetical protein
MIFYFHLFHLFHFFDSQILFPVKLYRSADTPPIGGFTRKMKNIEALPTVIFQLIQSYCSREGYRKLMNTNQATFKWMKFETVYFCFKIHQGLDQQEEEDTLYRLMNRVMDKSKQISIAFTHMRAHPMISMTNVWEGVEKIILKPPPYSWFDRNFSFQAFHSIIDLNLEFIDGIAKANLYLEKTRKLKLRH